MGFQDLIVSRHGGMGLSPIWWTTVQEYSEKKELSPIQTEDMHYHIKALDTAFLKHSAKKNK